MSHKNQEIHIQILKWANKKGKFTQKEITDRFPEYKDLITREISHSNLFTSSTPESNEYFLSFEDRFRLLDYEELQEARKSAEEAKWYAIAAMGISIVVGLIQIIIELIPKS